MQIGTFKYYIVMVHIPPIRFREQIQILSKVMKLAQWYHLKYSEKLTSGFFSSACYSNATVYTFFMFLFIYLSLCQIDIIRQSSLRAVLPSAWLEEIKNEDFMNHESDPGLSQDVTETQGDHMTKTALILALIRHFPNQTVQLTDT